MKTSLYRHFDKEGNLLYVGISLNALTRLGQHSAYSTWYKSIANVTIEHFETREDALHAETKAIIKEKPAHNIQKTKTIIEEDKREEIQNARDMLTKKIVYFNPMYTVDEVCNILNIGSGTFYKLIDDGILGHVIIPPKPGLSAHGTPFKAKTAVTGWQLIDYIEYLEKKYA